MGGVKFLRQWHWTLWRRSIRTRTPKDSLGLFLFMSTLFDWTFLFWPFAYGEHSWISQLHRTCWRVASSQLWEKELWIPQTLNAATVSPSHLAMYRWMKMLSPCCQLRERERERVWLVEPLRGIMHIQECPRTPESSRERHMRIGTNQGNFSPGHLKPQVKLYFSCDWGFMLWITKNN